MPPAGPVQGALTPLPWRYIVALLLSPAPQLVLLSCVHPQPIALHSPPSAPDAIEQPFLRGAAKVAAAYRQAFQVR